MRKKIKKWGTSAVIILNSEELKVYNLKVDDIIKIKINKLKEEEKTNGNVEEE